MNQQIQHPLINPESSHYESESKSAIEELEEQLSLSEMIGACKFNIFKYTYRQDKKGQKEADLKKIETYVNYLKFLEELEDSPDVHGWWIVKNVYDYCGIQINYKAV